MATTGTCRTDGEIDSSQMKNSTEVHIHRRIHRLKNQAITQHLGIVLFVHNSSRLYHRLGRRIISENTAHLVLLQILAIYLCHIKRLATGHESILRFFRHSCANMSVEIFLGNYGLRYDSHQPRAIAIAQTVLIQSDSRFSLIKRFFDSLYICTQA